jgi:D-proline reductase (dithiol) PrdB
VGLVARRIEAAGIPTVTLNMIWVYHRIVGMPRVAAIEHPFGRPFGDVADAETQRAVLLAALRVFAEAQAGVATFPSSGARSQARRVPREPSPIIAMILAKVVW